VKPFLVVCAAYGAKIPYTFRFSIEPELVGEVVAQASVGSDLGGVVRARNSQCIHSKLVTNEFR
jgi:hypothetical protein